MVDEKTLDVLHHEDRRGMHTKDSEVFAIEEVLLVGLEVLIVRTPGAPRKRVRLAWRTTDEQPVVGTIERRPDSRINLGCGHLSQLGMKNLSLSLPAGVTNLGIKKELVAIDLAAKKLVVPNELTCIRKVSTNSSHLECLAGDGLLLH